MVEETVLVDRCRRAARPTTATLAAIRRAALPLPTPFELPIFRDPSLFKNQVSYEYMRSVNPNLSRILVCWFSSVEVFVSNSFASRPKRVEH